MSIKVSIISEKDVAPETLASHGARICYEAVTPPLDQLKLIDVKGRLFGTGHHTTLQHSSFTFLVEGMSVSSVCMGLHVATPFYNTSQRSGRFSRMYDNPNLTELQEYLVEYFPGEDVPAAMKFVEKGLGLYSDNIARLREIALEKTKIERPYANEKYLATNVPKFAQEQLRVFVPLVAPTALDYSIDLPTLAALYREAWSPEFREIVSQMAARVVERYPELEYMFEEDKLGRENWTPIDIAAVPKTMTAPSLAVTNVCYDDDKFVIPAMKDAVSTLYFTPKYLINTQMHVAAQVEVSLATMGDDQRHRSIKRSAPQLTGAFYVPPLVKEAGLEEQALEFITDFYNLGEKISLPMMTCIAPYGAMAAYGKKMDLNALLHEQGKRTCWCASAEIHNIGTQLRAQLADMIGEDSKLVQALAPSCYAGECREAVRYCGRDIRADKAADYFKARMV